MGEAHTGYTKPYKPLASNPGHIFGILVIFCIFDPTFAVNGSTCN